MICASILAVMIVVNLLFIVEGNKNISNTLSISPNFKNVLSIRVDKTTAEAVYYRSYFKIFARPKENLTGEIAGPLKVKWLENDIAVVTYKAKNEGIQQFVATYGDRGSGVSYYEVGSEIRGEWAGKDVKILSDQQGISINDSKKTEVFPWEQVEQFGTLAIVLKRDDMAVWTISLNKNFSADSNSYQSNSKVGNISLYKATMEDNESIKLKHINSESSMYR